MADAANIKENVMSDEQENLTLPEDYIVELITSKMRAERLLELLTAEIQKLRGYLQGEGYLELQADDEELTVSELAIRGLERWYQVWDAERQKPFEQRLTAEDRALLADFHIKE